MKYKGFHSFLSRWGLFFVPLFLLLTLNILWADSNADELIDYSQVKKLKWVGPGKPGTYSEYIAIHPLVPIEIKSVDLPRLFFVPEPDAPRVLIFVNDTLYPNIQVKLERYVADMEIQGYAVDLYTCNYGTAEQLKQFITEHSTGLAGCVLIGDIPCAWYEVENDCDEYGYAEFPCDLFLMDLDGEWRDDRSDGPMQEGVYDGHLSGSGDEGPEIFVGRIDASRISGDTEANLTNNYLDKLHQFYTGGISQTDYALTYTEDDWSEDPEFWEDISYAYPENGAIKAPAINRDDYRNNRLASATYEFIQLACHSNSGGHKFERGGWLSSNAVKSVPPQALFYNLFCCSALRFTDDNCLGGAYLFNQSNTSLATIGSTKTGSMLVFHKFYSVLGEEKSFGEAFKEWFDYLAPYSQDEIYWHYGMTIIGDPLVEPCAPPLSLQPDNLISLSPYSNYIGDNIYNLTGFGQTKIVNIDFNMTQRYYVKVQNDGNVPQVIYVHAGGDFGGDWEAHFYNQQTGEEITQQIVQTPGWSTGTLAPGGEKLIRLEVTSPDKGEIGDWLTIGVESTSSLDNTKQDMVIAKTQIVGSGSPLIKVTQPNGGESWMANTHRRIYWEADATISNVKIELSRNSGASWDEVITSSTPNDGEYRWLITEPSSNACRVKVSEVGNPAVFDISDNNFTIRSDDDFPHPDFEADDTLVVINEPVTFTNLSTNGPFKRFEWAFGDGTHKVTYDVNTKVTHRFDYDDDFTITLDAYKYIGGPDTLVATKQREDYIHVLKNAPHITASPSSFHVTLAPDESEDHNLTIGNTGDGTLNWNLEESPSVAWLREDPVSGSVPVDGQQAVTLTFDAGGFVDTTMVTWLLIHSNDPEENRNPLKVSCTLTVTPPPSPPVANFSGSPRTGDPPLPVNFTDQSTGLVSSWFWDFGDDGTSTLKNPSHTYQNVGSYDVALTVTGPGGSDTETKTDYITVGSPPVADFSGEPTSGCAPLEVDFTDESTGDPTSWLWDFGDGQTSTDQNPTHIYDDPGSYTVSLTATNSVGSDTKTKTDYITVGSEPGAAFSADPVEGCPPLEVSFTDESSGYPDSWQWDFGDGGSSSESDPNYTYEEPGTYTVSLTVSNACGEDTETKQDFITIWAPDIAVNPDHLSSELEKGNYETTTFRISNTGDCILSFSIEESQSDIAAPAISPGATTPGKSDQDSQSMLTPQGTSAKGVSPSAQVQSAPAGLNGEVKPQTPIEQRILFADIDWLSVWPTQGDVDPGSHTTIQVTFNAVDQDSGTYVGYLVITSNDPDENPLAVVCSLKVNETPGGIEEGMTSIPIEFSLDPISPSIVSAGSMAKVSYALPKATRVSILIYDVNGRRVKTLVDGEMPAGYYQLSWDTRDDRGMAVSSGSYFCRMQASEFVASKKVVITGGFSVRGNEKEDEDIVGPKD